VAGSLLAALPTVEVLEGLGQPVVEASPPSAPVSAGRAPDDSDVGWGERPEPADDDRRYLEDRPPHWGSD
jgi:hypothetical protein